MTKDKALAPCNQSDQKYEKALEKIPEILDQLLEEMVQQQQKKVLQIAQQHLPHLTGDDILNPHDFPELMAHPIFNYEEGIAAGYMAAQIAVRACLLRLAQNPDQPQRSSEIAEI